MRNQSHRQHILFREKQKDVHVESSGILISNTDIRRGIDGSDGSNFLYFNPGASETGETSSEEDSCRFDDLAREGFRHIKENLKELATQQSSSDSAYLSSSDDVESDFLSADDDTTYIETDSNARIAHFFPRSLKRCMWGETAARQHTNGAVRLKFTEIHIDSDVSSSPISYSSSSICDNLNTTAMHEIDLAQKLSPMTAKRNVQKKNGNFTDRNKERRAFLMRFFKRKKKETTSASDVYQSSFGQR